MLAIVNSRNAEDANQRAIEAAHRVLVRTGHPYEVFLEHERYMTPDLELHRMLGDPKEDYVEAWMNAEDTALGTLPLVDDDVYLIWMGDN